MKSLLPTLKERKRYVAYELLNEADIRSAQEDILGSYIRLFGEVGAADAGIMFIPEKSGKNKGILRISHNCVDKLRAAFAVSETKPRCIGVSGMLNKAEKMLNKK